MDLKSLKLSAPEKIGYADSPTLEQPEYPWGLRIELNEESIQKLGLDTLPSVGQRLAGNVIMEIQSVSIAETTEGGRKRNMTLQITDMSVGPHQDKEPRELSQIIYLEDN